MIPVTSFSGRTVAVFGLGASGRASALALAAGGATVAAWDDSEDAVAAARAAGIAVVDLRVADWQAFAALVLAPGVPLTHPAAALDGGQRERRRRRDRSATSSCSAASAGVTCPQAPFIAITGTNGKSTTTALIAHLLREAGRDVQMGGNIGRAILSLEPPAVGRHHVIECSSFQIDLAPSLDPSVGVLLNITPDHLDRHGTIGGLRRDQGAAGRRRPIPP